MSKSSSQLLLTQVSADQGPTTPSVSMERAASGSVTPKRRPPLEVPWAPVKAPRPDPAPQRAPSREVGQKAARCDSVSTYDPTSPLAPAPRGAYFDPEDALSMMGLAGAFGYFSENQMGMVDMGRDIYWHVRTHFGEKTL